MTPGTDQFTTTGLTGSATIAVTAVFAWTFTWTFDGLTNLTDICIGTGVGALAYYDGRTRATYTLACN